MICKRLNEAFVELLSLLMTKGLEAAWMINNLSWILFSYPDFAGSIDMLQIFTGMDESIPSSN